MVGLCHSTSGPCVAPLSAVVVALPPFGGDGVAFNFGGSGCGFGGGNA
jgi:hypothetical protein